MKGFLITALIGSAVSAAPYRVEPYEDLTETASCETTVAPPTYPFDIGPYPKIRPAHFRCRGSRFHPALKDGEEVRSDCLGTHSLTIRDGHEEIYPILLDLLNYVQDRSGKQVIVTCGHRCPKHNTYCDPSKEARTSKHLIGAEVDFYVVGLEDNPQAVVNLLINYYQDTPYAAFSRYDKQTNVSMRPWYNKEVFIKLFGAHEGRDGDNDHLYPYLSIQVRYDRDRDKPVSYSWEVANKGYARGGL